MRSDADIEEAIAQHGDAVLRACRASLSHAADAEDVFQEVFIRYASREEPFNGEDHRKAWLLRVAINRCHDVMRRSSEADCSLDEVHDAIVPTEADRVEGRMTVQQALTQLSSDQRTAVLLSVVEGYPAREIAAIMDKPENTVYSLITRGKSKLKEVLER